MSYPLPNQIYKHYKGCCEPDCYLDNDWIKNLKKYVERGDSVKMISTENGIQLGKFECNIRKEEPNLFNQHEKNTDIPRIEGKN